MTARPLLLDLFCCEGGAAMGYYRAGFDVVGVDIDPQPRYPFPFVQSDALDVVFCLINGDPIGWPGHGPVSMKDIAAIHASPPCQLYSVATAMHDRTDYPDLVGPTRVALQSSGVPWVIENVEGSPLGERGQLTFDGRVTVMLCGSMFGIRRLQRHRLFESDQHLVEPGRCRHEESQT